ncbi:MAG TPA: hypothetical protein VJN43_02680 [Bryobacteraceae bacterium]|nr:hypothetical protein [Bryobacteraceae bacterium]
MAPTQTRDCKLGMAWVALCAALVLHVIDEASTGFLSVYNPTVMAMRQRFAWFPMPTFEFREWLTGLAIANLVLLALAPFAFRGARWMRPLAYVFAIVMLLNGAAHTTGTILGRTVEAVRFVRPMPGFYSSPALLAASTYLLIRLRKPTKDAS